ncbi:MAG: bifunctional phosphopantothenoylcysteine decarboxylase/phosphopantothenate--cysteine ligase CoaBC [Crenarchaeota archaeon]|nr:bifunctional phosphopantothenoylcysteine decarboxylase/phosphopantothenate--cysteine ligase CoaBC [Thermoproteota archaeon]
MSLRERIEIESSLLKDKNVLLGITGSIASYRSVDLCRKLRKNSANVKVVVSRSALRYVTRSLLSWAVNGEVYDIETCDGKPIHVELAEWCDVYCICPCTLNTLSRICTGSVSDLPSLCAVPVLGLGKPILIVPVMSQAMWDSPITRRLVRDLQTLSCIHILYPDISAGRAKIPSIDRIFEKIVDLTCPRDMEELKVLVTAGATREWLDPTKYLTTPSSGIEGAYFAREADARGAEVYLVHGYLSEKAREIIKDTTNVHTYHAESTREMYNIVKELDNSHSFDIVIFAAAPLDYEIVDKFNEKIDTRRVGELKITLRRAPYVVSAVEKARVKIGFKLEWNRKIGESVDRALERMSENDLDIVIIHDACKVPVFGSLYDTVIVIDRFGICRLLENIHKRELARHILTMALRMLGR